MLHRQARLGSHPREPIGYRSRCLGKFGSWYNITTNEQGARSVVRSPSFLSESCTICAHLAASALFTAIDGRSKDVQDKGDNVQLESIDILQNVKHIPKRMIDHPSLSVRRRRVRDRSRLDGLLSRRRSLGLVRLLLRNHRRRCHGVRRRPSCIGIGRCSTRCWVRRRSPSIGVHLVFKHSLVVVVNEREEVDAKDGSSLLIRGVPRAGQE